MVKVTVPEEIAFDTGTSAEAIHMSIGFLDMTNWDPDDDTLNIRAAQVWATIAVARAMRNK